jgi:hypothetical protein
LADFDDGFRLTALYELHGNLTATGNLKWYIGGGAHGGYYDKGEVDGMKFGIDAVAGLDYKFAHLPLNLSLDWQPAYEFLPRAPNFRVAGAVWRLGLLSDRSHWLLPCLESDSG